MVTSVVYHFVELVQLNDSPSVPALVAFQLFFFLEFCFPIVASVLSKHVPIDHVKSEMPLLARDNS